MEATETKTEQSTKQDETVHVRPLELTSHQVGLIAGFQNRVAEVQKALQSLDREITSFFAGVLSCTNTPNETVAGVDLSKGVMYVTCPAPTPETPAESSEAKPTE